MGDLREPKWQLSIYEYQLRVINLILLIQFLSVCLRESAFTLIGYQESEVRQTWIDLIVHYY